MSFPPARGRHLHHVFTRRGASPELTVRGEEVRNQTLHSAHNFIEPSRTVTQHQTVRDSAWDV